MWDGTSVTGAIVAHSFTNINMKGCVFLMADNSESFRNELVSRLFNSIPQDQMQNVLNALDATVSGYDISHKPTALITTDGIPEVVKYYLVSKAVENLSQGTLKIYRLRLIDFFNVVKKIPTDIRASDIRSYLFFCQTQRNASDAYRDTIRRILNAFFAWLCANDYTLKNPCASVERIKYQTPQRVPLTAYELEDLRWHCKTIREKALVDFLYSTGVRASECTAVNIADIDWVSRSVVIHHGKGNKRRMVYFNAESELTLRKYLETRSDSSEALFVTSRNPHHRLGIRGLQNEISRISERCSMHAHPHKLRHTFATSGLQGGMSLDKLQALMGHAKPETTLIYAKLDQTDIQREHRRVYA